jgi:hypothetical protein
MEKERRGSEEVGKRAHRRQISLFYYHFRCYLVLSLDNQC